MRARDHMLEKHPGLQFIGAHLGSLEWSVDELAKRLDKFPNMAVDMAARISHLQYQAKINWQKVHDFCIKYQDRLLYATDILISGSESEHRLKSRLMIPGLMTGDFLQQVKKCSHHKLKVVSKD